MAILSQIAAGSFVADGSPLVLPFAGTPDIVRLYYQGSAAGDVWESAANPGVVKECYWNRNMADASALTTKNTAGAATDTKDFLAVGGVEYYNPQFGQLGPAIVGTAISQANPASVTAAGHGLQTGDIVLITGSTGMLQIAGMYFQITRTGVNTFTLDGLDSSGFAAPATACVVRKVLYPGIWQPQSCLITKITQAADAVITTSVDHGYVADQLIYLSVAPQFGMSEAAGKITKIKSVTANTMTVELDTTGFTAFAFPASAAGPFDFPNLSNYGADSSLVLNAYRNDAVAGVYLGSAVCGSAGALVHYEIIQADSFAAV
jgi:hypothetical protein